MAKKAEDRGSPVFPYTTEPKALRRLLTEIPKRPKPPKLDLDKLKAWNVSSNNNARSAINVLKKIGLLNEAGAPNEQYVEFMKTGIGPGVLGARIREVYRPLFEASLAPQSESDEELRKLFHIHTGGGDDVMRFQIQTFKALAEYASFVEAAGSEGKTPPPAGSGISASGTGQFPPVQIDLHIHLPENKSARDYEAIIQDIAKYIYGRSVDGN